MTAYSGNEATSDRVLRSHFKGHLHPAGPPPNLPVEGAAQFLRSSAALLRGILVDWWTVPDTAKLPNAEARCEATRLPLDDALPPDESRPDLVAIDDALDELKAIDPRKYHIVMRRSSSASRSRRSPGNGEARRADNLLFAYP